jgi:hypothetical protein
MSTALRLWPPFLCIINMTLFSYPSFSYQLKGRTSAHDVSFLVLLIHETLRDSPVENLDRF